MRNAPGKRDIFRCIIQFQLYFYTRHKTKKKHEQALKLAQENKTKAENTKETKEASVTPLNVKYSKLTTGFRADNK